MAALCLPSDHAFCNCRPSAIVHCERERRACRSSGAGIISQPGILASSVEKKEPKSKCEQGRQAGIHHDRRRERFSQVHRQQQEPSSRRQQNSQGQANKPSREKGTQDVERWSLLTTRKRKHANQKQHSRSYTTWRVSHGWSLEPLIRIRSPVRKARSARVSRTCVRAATSAVRACASARCAAVTSSKLRTP